MNTAAKQRPRAAFIATADIELLAQRAIHRHAPDYILIGFAEMLVELAGPEEVPALIDLVAVAREVARTTP